MSTSPLEAHTTERAGRRPWWRRAIASVATGAICATLMLTAAPQASADSLDDARAQVRSALANSKKDLAAANDKLSAAEATLSQTRKELQSAQADLAAKQAARDAAAAEDARLAAALATAEQELADAKARVEQGKIDVANQKRQIGLSVQSTTQQNSALVGISLLLSETDTAAISNRMQWTETIFNVTQAEMDRLQTLQAELEKAEADLTAAEANVRSQREAAAAALSASESATADASAAAAAVASKLNANQQAEAQARSVVEGAKQQGAALAAEEAQITAKIKARIAAEEAARKAAEAAAAAKNNSSGSSNSGSSNSSSESSSATFLRPVPGRITSPFGWRIHPILGYNKLHSGIDLAASCGTPVKAAEDGTVVENEYRSSLGNYVLIDHGRISGNYYSTGYGHLSRSIVHVGQHVSRGQVIAYAGTTGDSTGCHLHFNVLKNGDYVNGAAYI